MLTTYLRASQEYLPVGSMMFGADTHTHARAHGKHL